MAQDDPNHRRLDAAAGLDVPSLYYFRGYRQETDPELDDVALCGLRFWIASRGRAR